MSRIGLYLRSKFLIKAHYDENTNLKDSHSPNRLDVLTEGSHNLPRTQKERGS